MPPRNCQPAHVRHLKPNVNLVGVVGPTRLVGPQPDLYSFLKHNFHCLQGGLLIDHRHLHHTLQDTFLIFQVIYFAGIIPYDCLSLSDDYIRFDNSNLLSGSWFFSDLAWNQSQIWLHLFTNSLKSKPCLMALKAAGPASHYAVFVAAGVVLHSSGTCFFDCWAIGHRSQIVTELGSVNKNDCRIIFSLTKNFVMLRMFRVYWSRPFKVDDVFWKRTWANVNPHFSIQISAWTTRKRRFFW